MEIKGFNVLEEKSKSNGLSQIIVKDVSDLSPYGFDIGATFESGQCFRWKKVKDDCYSGIVRDKAVFVSLVNNRDLLIENATAMDFNDLWHGYFDLATDYAPIIRAVTKDEFMRDCVNFAGGARVLQQDFEETLFSYILSSQNNIPRIKNLVENLCVRYGEKIYSNSPGLENQIIGYSFPGADALSKRLCKNDVTSCNSSNLCQNPFAGYRCPYIKRTAQMICEKEISLDFKLLATQDASLSRKALCRFWGVGEKVADCVLLYSGIRKDICPIDTWVEKTINARYLGENVSKSDIRNFTESYFEGFAGYAQLWFFHYARNH